MLLPIYLNFLGVPRGGVLLTFSFLFTLAMAALMISRLPVLSGKRVGKRVPPDMVVPIFVAVAVLAALLISYPWQVLSAGTIAYLALLPLGIVSYRKHQLADETARLAAASPAKPRDLDEAVAGQPLPDAADDHPSTRH